MATLLQQSVEYVKSKLAGNPPYEPNDIAEEQTRILKASKLYSFYTFDRKRILDYVSAAMKTTFKADTITKMQFPLYNLTKKVIHQLAVAYIEPAQRYVVVPKASKTEGTETIEIVDPRADKDNETYQGILEQSNINAVAKEWNRQAKLFTTVYVGVAYRNGKIEYELFPPHTLTVKQSAENYLEPALVQYDRAFGGDTYTIEWTDTTHRILDKNGQMVPGQNDWGGVNKYGVIPIIPCRLSIPDDHWGEGDQEIVSINEKIDILIASMYYNAIMQSHSTAFAVNLNVDEEEGGEIKTGPGYIVEAKNVLKDDYPPDFRFVSPNPATEENIRAIDWLVKTAAVMKGLSAQSVSPDVNEASGVSKNVDMMELRERRADDIEFLRPFEKRLFDVTRTVWNTNEPQNKISDDAVFGIDFVEPKVALTPGEEWSIKERKMALGLYSPVMDMVDEDEGIDEAQALAYIKRNMEHNRQIRNASGETRQV